MLPFTFFPSEDVALVALLLCTGAGWVISGRHQVLLRRLLMFMVAGAFVDWCLLLATGVVRPWQGPLAELHGVVGHLMLPLVASAAGLWLGASVSQESRRPAGILVRLLVLLLLCFCCFSNARTGYLGPSRIDPASDWPTKLRFDVFHQVTMPAIMGPILAFWLGRLVVRAPQSGPVMLGQSGNH
jgi:hypothetical protein